MSGTENDGRLLNDWLIWIVFIAICLGAGAVGSWFTSRSVKTWYPNLLKPVGTPPPWVFGPVWTTLYVLMGTAVWLIWRQRHVSPIWLPLAWFVVQLALNTAWSYIFFGLRRPGAALVEIVFLLAAIVVTSVLFARVSRVAPVLMVPYIVWVAYATYLNSGIWRLNRGVI